jgi:Ala-tRNA(Pro) deacylase
MTVQDFMRELAGSQLGYEPITHRQTMTAGDEAMAIGVSATEVAKTLVLSTATGRVRAVLSACDRLDLHKVRDLLGDGKSVRLASERELEEAYPMFELGAVPPFGGPAGERTIVDRRLADQETIVIEAGSHSESVRIKTLDLLALTQAETAEISAD